MAKVVPKGITTSDSCYDVLYRFPSNEIKVASSRLFMNLTPDQLTVRPNNELCLTWIIDGIEFYILTSPKNQNCIGFYRVSVKGSPKDTGMSAGYVKIEVVPESAYSEADTGKLCAGRMVVTAPSEPGMYEIRFLLNYFKYASLHRECQTFGALEHEMQALRIRSFNEKRVITNALNKFNIHDANNSARKWLVNMIKKAVDGLLSTGKMMYGMKEDSEIMLENVGAELKRGLESQLSADQELLRCIVRPLAGTAFFDILLVALDSSSHINDQLDSIILPVATDEDLKKIKEKRINKYYQHTLLPLDAEIRKAAGIYQSNLTYLALEYLQRESLCGFHDLVDDIVLTHELLVTTIDQIVNDVASSCITLYEKSICEAIDNVVSSYDDECKAVLQHIEPLLLDLCRNHMQQIVRAFLDTDHNPNHCGLKWESSLVLGARHKLEELKSRENDPLADNEDSSAILKPPERDSVTPVTLHHIIVRKWIIPLLTRKIHVNLRQRYARAVSKSFISPSAWWPPSQFLPCTASKRTIKPWDFPSMWATPMPSPLYFIREGQDRKRREDERAARGEDDDRDQDEGFIVEDEEGETDGEEELQNGEDNDDENDEDDNEDRYDY